MALAIFLGVFGVSLLMGMPIAFSMMFSGCAYALINGGNLAFLSLELFRALDNFTLVAIPMFLLTAEVMTETSIADRIFDFGNSLVGFIPGGLGHVNVLTSVIFSGMSGSAVADVGGIGYLSYKAMADNGYEKPFSAAVTAATACIGPIIPPSIPMVVFAMVADASIGSLFVGGVIPGLLMALTMSTYIYYVSIKKHYPISKKLSGKEIVNSFKKAILPLLTPIILLGGIVLGVVTVTEAAVLAVAYSCLIGAMIYKRLGVKQFIQCLERVFVASGSVLILFPAAKMFSYVLVMEDIPIRFTHAVLNVTSSPIAIILLINVIFLILGCFVSPTINIILFVPLMLPLVDMINMDLIQFGVMVVLNVMIGTLTPPVGSMAFIISSLADISIESVFKALGPLILVLIIVLLMVAFIPQLSTLLPALLLG